MSLVLLDVLQKKSRHWRRQRCALPHASAGPLWWPRLWCSSHDDAPRPRLLALVALAAPLCAEPASPWPSPSCCWARAATGSRCSMVRHRRGRRHVVPGPARPGRRRAAALAPRQRPDGGQFDQVMVCEARLSGGPAGQRADRRAHHRPAGRRARHAAPHRPAGRQRLPRRRPTQAAILRRRRLRQDVAVRHDFGRGRAAIAPTSSSMSATTTIAARRAPWCCRTSATGYAQDLRVNVFDTGDLDDEDDEPRIPIGPAYWSQNMQGSPMPDNWANWRDDFFIPSSRLLVAAPWILNRGNHELCSRAGPGWFYLLDAGSPLLGSGPPAERLPAADTGRLAARRVAQLPPCPSPASPSRRSPNRRCACDWEASNIIAFNSSDAGDAALYALDHYVAQYRLGRRDAGRGHDAHLDRHPPADLGVVEEDQGRRGRRRALRLHQHHPAGRARDACFPTACRRIVTAVIAGHMHRFQAIGFGGRRPPQLVVGTGGMELSHVQPAALAGRSQAADPRARFRRRRRVTWSASAISARWSCAWASAAPGRAPCSARRARPWRPAIRPGRARAADDRCAELQVTLQWRAPSYRAASSAAAAEQSLP